MVARAIAHQCNWREASAVEIGRCRRLRPAAAFFSLGPEHAAKNAHGLLDFGNGDAAVELFPLAPRSYDAGRLQHSEVLGEVGFRNAESLLQFRRPPFSLQQHFD